jgi:hypothetical protein
MLYSVLVHLTNTGSFAVKVIMNKILDGQEDQEIESEGYNTWTINNWKSLGKKEHGPNFDVGGIPWYEEAQENSYPRSTC